ncbi:acyltransferase family protein [Akkermansia massiliensis]
MLPVRNYGLDLLRILLCLTVVFFHYSGGWNCGGSVAVDGFFVLSGFLAVRSAGGSTQGSIGEYYRKKGWRLLPVLLIAWAAGLAVLFVEGQQSTAWAGVRLLIAAPTLAMWKMMGNAAVWFIVCIMAFLALFPWLYRYYGKKPFLWLLAASVLFAAFRIGTMVDYDRLYYQVSFRLWQFLLGMWCASWNMERWKSPWRWFWIGAGAAWLLASSAASHEGIGALNYSFPGYVVSSGIFALCIASLWSVRLPSLPASLLKWMGIGAGMTYSLFLFHMPVLRGMAEVFRMLREHAGMEWRVDKFPVLFWGIALCVSLVISYFLYQHVEVRWVGKKLKKTSATRNEAWERAGENGTDEIFRKR